MNLKPVIALRRVSKSFGDQRVLAPLTLDIRDGEFLTLLGPSGCGKTTLLRLLAGFERPDTGSIHLRGRPITGLPPEARCIHMVFQSYALFPHLSVFENVAFGLRCRQVADLELRERVMKMLKRVRMDDLAFRRPQQLSGGQQQRVAIARALVNEPQVLLLDEPLSALDYHLRRNMRIELKALQRRLGITFIFVTHDQEEALSLSDRIVVMNDGRIEQLGTPRDIYEEPKNLFVANFVGDANLLEKVVLAANAKTIEVEVAGTRVHFINSGNFSVGDRVTIVIRPEDFRVWSVREVDPNDEHEYLPATVTDVIYKGSTVDLRVKLADGQPMAATEFFDEDDDELEYDVGEKVLVQWRPGWEVVLSDQKSLPE